jgi:hypothetical protein
MNQVDENILAFSSKFVGYCKQRLRHHPAYLLDLSWPSVGVVDLLCNHLRQKKEYEDIDISFINGAAAYLAQVAFPCWAQFPDQPEIKVYFEPQKKLGVIIEAKGGMHATKGLNFSVNISEALSKILAELPYPYPYYGTATRQLSANHNYLSPLMIGLVLGYTPYGEGHWKTLAEDQFKPRSLIIDNYLSMTAASYYQSVFPTEPIGASANIYRGGLILPPFGHNDAVPGGRGATILAARLKQECKNSDEIFKVALNLARSPDESISLAGFCVATALQTENVPNSLKAISQSLYDDKIILRPAIILARKVLGLPANWMESTRVIFEEQPADKNKKLFAIQNLIDIESELGLLPLLALPSERIHSKEYLEVFNALIWNQVNSAYELLKSNEEPSADIIIQRCLLCLGLDKMEEAEKLLSSLETFNIPWKHAELKGLIEFKQSSFPNALESFTKAARLTPAHFGLPASLLKVLGLVASKENKISEILQLFIELAASRPDEYLLNSYIELLSDSDVISDRLKALLSLTPFDRDLFSLALGISDASES